MKREPSESPLVSVLINNYNYARFLREAIDSALNQTYPNIEVVVVDDGSTDNSREIIASYGDRIIPVLKHNGGQASAFNAGFAVSQGEIVAFLDADDILLPETVGRVVTAFQSRPGVAKVQYRLRNIDASSTPTGEVQPPARLPMPSGDLRQRMLELNWYAWPPTSGNAFAASVLRRIMPVPEDVYWQSGDVYLCHLSVVFGEVLSLELPGGLYRIHGKNNYFDSTTSVNLNSLRHLLVAVEDSYVRMKQLFGTLYSIEAHTLGSRHLHSLRSRIISLKLDPDNHPFDDTLWTLFVRGCRLSITHPDSDISSRKRLLYLIWFAAMLSAPRLLARMLARAHFLK